MFNERGQLEQARKVFERSLSFARAHGDRFLESTSLLNLGLVSLKQERFDEAIESSEASYRVSSAIGAADVALVAQGNLGWAYYKLGDGPFYVFYTPFHLPHIQIASTIGRAVIHRDPTVAPMAGPVCEVVTVCKRDLKAGEPIDGIGGFCVYGLIDNSAAARAIGALPIALSQGCVMRHDVSKDHVLSFADVMAPTGRLTEALWREQTTRWPNATSQSVDLFSVPVANL